MDKWICMTTMMTNINLLILATITNIHAHSVIPFKYFTKVASGGQIMGDLQAVSMWKSHTHLIYRYVPYGHTILPKCYLNVNP